MIYLYIFLFTSEDSPSFSAADDVSSFTALITLVTLVKCEAPQIHVLQLLRRGTPTPGATFLMFEFVTGLSKRFS